MTLTLYWSEAKQDVKQPISCVLLQSCAVVSRTLRTVKTRYPYIQHSRWAPGNYCMLLVSSCQGESSTSARLKCCQSFNSPGGLGLERKRFSLLWKQKRQSRQYYAIGNSTIALFELCLSFKLICCLAPRSAQEYLAFRTHFQTIGVNSFQAGLNLSV